MTEPPLTPQGVAPGQVYFDPDDPEKHWTWVLGRGWQRAPADVEAAPIPSRRALVSLRRWERRSLGLRY